MNFYPHHIGDFRSGTFNMTRLERWIYRDMLDVYYDTETPFPLELEKICVSVGARTDEEKIVVSLILDLKFSKTAAGYVHQRCTEEIRAYHLRAETAQNNGKLGGRPPKKNPAETEEKPSGLFAGSDEEPNPNPETTGLKANQEPLTNNHKPRTKESKTSADAPFSAKAYLADEGVDAQTAADWLKLRAAKKAPASRTALDSVKREAHAAGLTMAGALEICCSRGWQGFKAEWVARTPDRRANPQPTDLAAAQRAANEEAKRRLGIGQQEVIDAR